MRGGGSRGAARRVAGLAFVAPVLGACGLTGPAHGPADPNAAAVVTMGFESYAPVTVTIRAGNTVEWQNTSLITHTVTDDPKLAVRAADAALPTGVPAFNSGDIPAGQVYLRKFAAPGTYRYFCVYHEKSGMLGTVVVMPAS